MRHFQGKGETIQRYDVVDAFDCVDPVIVHVLSSEDADKYIDVSDEVHVVGLPL